MVSWDVCAYRMMCMHMGVYAYGCMHRVYVQWWLGVCISI